MEFKNDFGFLENKMSIEQYQRYNDIESWLYNYKIAEVAIENLKAELVVLDTLKSVNIEIEGKGLGKVSSSVEDIQAEKEKIKSRIMVMESKLNKLNKALDALKEEELYVIKSFYINQERYKEIGNKMQCSIISCKRIKKKALNKIIIGVYGEL
ncbi:sigma-70 family RNA polymerase sigma factor [Sarcina ventriculi]|uniref:sigma-70 family RNA polymerase sigma factor n=1 Tax=Sarcina ventriculi TaxID=1267 RepID=UPI00073E4E5C|nr:sigma-70 family RNA polymerase sigma factor [Sarcina ventriculi]